MSTPPRVLLGVSGGIAAYKAVEVAPGTDVQRGADVRVAMTRGAREFVSPLTFSPSSRGTRSRPRSGGAETRPAVDHVELADCAAICCSSRRPRPTRSRSSRRASPTTSSRPTSSPTGARSSLAPGDGDGMWEHPAVRANVRDARRPRRALDRAGERTARLRDTTGLGRMAEPDAIVEAGPAPRDGSAPRPRRACACSSRPDRRGSRSTRSVSSPTARAGSMGYALAEAARDRGATA